MPSPRLVVFDCDGTIVDSEELIARSMGLAFRACGRSEPTRDAVRGIVGLALVEAIGRLLPAGTNPADVEAIAAAYRTAFFELRSAPDGGGEKPFVGAIETIVDLRNDGRRLAIATGKSRKGLDAVLRTWSLEPYFDTLQTVDSAPGKPDPGMVLNALRDTGIDAPDAIVVGDTTYDIVMAQRAGVASIGVSWGCHTHEALAEAGATHLVSSFAELRSLLGLA